jgi:hypothetical protein
MINELALNYPVMQLEKVTHIIRIIALLYFIPIKLDHSSQDELDTALDMQPVLVSPSAPSPSDIGSLAIDCESAGEPPSAIVGYQDAGESAIAHKPVRSSCDSPVHLSCDPCDI